MAICKRSTRVVCLAVLMMVMATEMLSCDAGPEWCESIGDGCSESKCRGRCGSLGYTNGFHCLKEGNTCCCEVSEPKPNLDVSRLHD